MLDMCDEKSIQIDNVLIQIVKGVEMNGVKIKTVQKKSV